MICSRRDFLRTAAAAGLSPGLAGAIDPIKRPGPKAELKSFAPLQSGFVGMNFIGSGRGNPPIRRVMGNEDRSVFARNCSGVRSISGDQMEFKSAGSLSIAAPKVLTAASLAWRTLPEESTTKAGQAALSNPKPVSSFITQLPTQTQFTFLPCRPQSESFLHEGSQKLKAVAPTVP